MSYQNLSKNYIKKISLYYEQVDEKIFSNKKFSQLISLIEKNKDINYALYTDNFLLKNNIFIPNFHTIYLSYGNHNVIIDEIKDLWLIETFKNNKYYFLIKEDLQHSDLENIKITKITNISEIINNDI
jgi:hypothetical protein